MGSPASKRNYQKENKWKATPAQIKKRVARNKARRQAIKAGRVKKGDGKVVGHTKAMSRGGINSSTRVESKSRSNKEGGRMSKGTTGKKLKRRSKK